MIINRTTIAPAGQGSSGIQDGKATATAMSVPQEQETSGVELAESLKNQVARSTEQQTPEPVRDAATAQELLQQMRLQASQQAQQYLQSQPAQRAERAIGLLA